MDLTGKIALVTGASRGIGRQIAVTLAGYGATVVVNYNGSQAKAEEVVSGIEANGGHAEAVQCNVAEFDAAKELINDARYENSILVRYHLGAHFKFNKTLGIGRFETQFEIDDFCYKEPLKGKDSFLNRGLYQCEFLGINPVINTNSVYTVDTVVNDRDAEKRLHLSFTVFGSYGEIIKEMFAPGQEITIVYKLERSKDERDDGEVEFFTNCILEKIV